MHKHMSVSINMLRELQLRDYGKEEVIWKSFIWVMRFELDL